MTMTGKGGVEAGLADGTERMAETTHPSCAKSRVIGVERLRTGGGTGQGFCSGVGTIGMGRLGSSGEEAYPSAPDSGEAGRVGGLGSWAVESSR